MAQRTGEFDALLAMVTPKSDPFNETGIINPFTDLPHTYRVPLWGDRDFGLAYMDCNPRDSAWAYYLRTLLAAEWFPRAAFHTSRWSV